MRPRRHSSTHGGGHPVRTPPDQNTLPPRVRPVLRCLLQGQSEKQVARTLGLRPNTVHSYVKLIYRDLGVNSRAELLARCLRRRRVG